MNKKQKTNKVRLEKWKTSNVKTANFAEIPEGVWLTGASIMWDKNIRGQGCIVGIIDTGVDDSHQDLQGKVIKRRDYVKDGRTTKQYNPHGTHVCGTICANGKIKGVAPETKIIDYRVLDVNGSGTINNVVKAIYDSVTDGCNIINLSLGSESHDEELHKAVAYAKSSNILVIVAAGNDGPGRISYPAGYKQTISIAAIEYNTNLNRITFPSQPWFSNSNSQVDFACDGWNVLSCIPGDSYAYFTGTSMAAPHAAGIASLLFSQLKSQSSLLKPRYSDLYSLLSSKAIDILKAGRDNVSGSGLLSFYPSIPKYPIS